MGNTFLSIDKYFCVYQAVFCYCQKFSKIIMKEKTLMSVEGSNMEMHYLNSCKTDPDKLICVNFCKSEFLNIKLFVAYMKKCL